MDDLKTLLIERIVQFNSLSFLDPWKSAQCIAEGIIEELQRKYIIKPRYDPKYVYEEMAE